MNTPVNEVRGVLIQIAGSQLLLPNAATVEVLSYAQPESIEHAPDWLLGQIRWRGWAVPLVSYARIAGTHTEGAAIGTKVVVLKALGGDPKLPYFGLVAQGFPRLVTVSRDALIVDSAHQETLPEGVRLRVMYNNDIALIPDLDGTERMIIRVLRPPVESAA
ncbi:MAG: chemotaxis protein CheW [Lysobacteraceae bacterium]|nr:MAG: chemotaxis protein CheW [Xanthomonadaceae bacterium]